MKILVADDSRVMRQIIIRTLRHAGYESHDMIEAANGQEAMTTIEAERPDLVLCDWHMPGMTGLQCLQTLRASGSAVPFGLITSDASPELAREAEVAGALFVLSKPFTEETLRHALEGGLQRVQEHSAEGSGDTGAEAVADLLPAAKDVRDMLIRLLNRPVTVRPGGRVRPTDESPVSLAVYADRNRSIQAVCLMDLALSAYAAGALALLPVGGVQDTVEDGELSPTLVEALREIANVFCAVVNTPGAPHAALDSFYPAGAVPPEELLVMASGFERLDLVVDVAGYGGGVLSLVRTA